MGWGLVHNIRTKVRKAKKLAAMNNKDDGA
jgi:hypothetical protein